METFRKNTMTIPVTGGFTIREWRLEDAESLAENANNVKIWNNLRDCFPSPYSLEDAYDFIRSATGNPQSSHFAIATGEKIAGAIGYTPSSDVERLNAEIGYWIAEPHWYKGIAAAAVHVFVNYIFKHTELIRLFAQVYEHNTSSMRVLEKNGFRKCCVMRKAILKNRKILDLHYYELLKEDFEKE